MPYNEVIMRRTAALFIVSAAVLVTACSDRSATDPAAPGIVANNRGVAAPAGCPDDDEILILINQLFVGGHRSAASAKFDQVMRFVGQGKTAQAREHALSLVDFALKKYRSGSLQGGTSTATATRLVTFLSGVLCWAGLPPFNPAALGLDGAAVVVSPGDPTTTIVTGTQWAGVEVVSGAVPQPTLITITRLPNTPGPLLTQFDQYPIYYEFSYNPGITFTVPVVVGTCLATGATPPDPSRLRLAHNVAPFTFGSVEILDIVPAPFLDCTDADISAAPANRWGLDLARGGLLLKGILAKALLPEPLMAARYRYAGGVGGSVRNFSPFGLVDTLAYVTRAIRETQWTFGGVEVDDNPAVTLTTPTGRPMAGITVNFAVTAGGGSLASPSPVSDANGLAAAGQWILGFGNPNEVRATPVAPPRTGFAGSPVSFFGVVLNP